MGIKGYKHPGRKHPVVAIKTDGSIAGYFEFIKDAVGRYGMDRHSITDSCKRGTICRGLKWMYEEDYRKFYQACRTNELAYTLDPNRDRITYHFKKGHQAGNGYSHRSTEDIMKHKEIVSEMMKQLHKNGKIRHRLKPIVCLTNNQQYSSIKEASEVLNIPQNYISQAIHKRIKTHGLNFRFKKEMEEWK